MRGTRALSGARIVFVVLALVLAVWGFHGRWDEIGEAAVGPGPARLGAAVLCAVAGLALTGVLWRMLLSSLGSHVPPRDGYAVFFVGQLGKYVPGSVWSFAAQAQLGRRYDVPVRSSVTASALFLVLHTVSGLVLGGILVAGGAVRTDLGPRWGWLLLAAVGVIALSPPVLRMLGDTLAGADVRTRLGGDDLVRCLALMAGVWTCYGACLWLLVPIPQPGPEDVLMAVAAFALAHAAGVLMVLAPAGLGAREAVLIGLLAPTVGVPAAAAAALLARVAHAVADFVAAAAAAGAVGWARRSTREPVGVGDA